MQFFWSLSVSVTAAPEKPFLGSPYIGPHLKADEAIYWNALLVIPGEEHDLVTATEAARLHDAFLKNAGGISNVNPMISKESI